MNLENLAARLDALESRVAIEALISGYANAFDRMDSKLLPTLWHADAILDLPGFGEGRGPAGILAMAETNWQEMPHMHHWMSNPLIQIKVTWRRLQSRLIACFMTSKKGRCRSVVFTTTALNAGRVSGASARAASNCTS